MQDQDLARTWKNEDDDNLRNATRINPDEFAVAFGIIDARDTGKISKEDFLNTVYIYDKSGHHRHSSGYFYMQELKHFIDKEASKPTLPSLSIFADDEYNSEGVPEMMLSNAYWKEAVIENISNFLFQSRLHLGAIFRAIDENNDGFISRTEFVDAMRMINAAFSNHLTDDQASWYCATMVFFLHPP